jgi:hypothetical protein
MLSCSQMITLVLSSVASFYYPALDENTKCYHQYYHPARLNCHCYPLTPDDNIIFNIQTDGNVIIVNTEEVSCYLLVIS